MTMAHNNPVNVPAARKVAERPASVTWRCGKSSDHDSNAWPCASPEIGPQVILYANRPLWYNSDTDSLLLQGCLTPRLRNSPPEGVSLPTSCRAAGLLLPALLTPLQDVQLERVVEDSHRVSHDPTKIVHDAQEVVVVYHLFLLRACCYASARRFPHRAEFARRQVRNTPRKARSFPLSDPTAAYRRAGFIKTRRRFAGPSTNGPAGGNCASTKKRNDPGLSTQLAQVQSEFYLILPSNQTDNLQIIACLGNCKVRRSRPIQSSVHRWPHQEKSTEHRFDYILNKRLNPPLNFNSAVFGLGILNEKNLPPDRGRKRPVYRACGQSFSRTGPFFRGSPLHISIP
jgi:hypothetical protein